MAKLNTEHVAFCLLTCPTLKDAAEKAGVSDKTLYRMRKDEEFKVVMKGVRNSIFQEAMGKAQAYSLNALEVLNTIMNTEYATDSSRVAAARTLLELGVSVYESEEIIARLDTLESRLSKND